MTSAELRLLLKLPRKFRAILEVLKTDTWPDGRPVEAGRWRILIDHLDRPENFCEPLVAWLNTQADRANFAGLPFTQYYFETLSTRAFGIMMDLKKIREAETS